MKKLDFRADLVWELDNNELTLYNYTESNTPSSKNLVTDNSGQIYIENLPWGNYYLEEVAVPDHSNYSDSLVQGWYDGRYVDRIDNNNGANDNKTILPNRTHFTVGRTNCMTVQELNCKDQMKPAYIMLNEHIDQWRPSEWGDPTFIYQIRQTGYYSDSTGEIVSTNHGKVITVALTVNDDENGSSDITTNYFDQTKKYSGWYWESTREDEYKSNKLYNINSSGMIKVEPGTYTISRINTSRYTFVEYYYRTFTSIETPNSVRTQAFGDLDNTLTNSTESEMIQNIEIRPYKIADVHYCDTVAYYDKFSQVDTEINSFHGIKGIRIEDYGSVAPVDANGDTTAVVHTNADKFKAYIIYHDGSETLMTDEQKQKLMIDMKSTSVPLVPLNTPKQNGDFAYSNVTDDPTITITNAERYANGIYPMKATYKPTDNGHTFETEFDLIIGPNNQHKIIYTYQVTFRNDADADNKSYFYDAVDTVTTDSVTTQKSERADDYEFTFLIYKDDSDRYQIQDIRHNGKSIGKDETEWRDAIAKVINAQTLETNAGYRNNFQFDSWKPFTYENGAESQTLNANYDDIKTYVLGQNPVITTDTELPLTMTPEVVFIAQINPKS